ncbi:MAG TPA: hypothetical protein VJ836_00770 [Candidatus Saccharimonadales bacterium]|nr:hypothetical protein [Candidatus Saccharimonadales bacterium]
MALTDNNMAGWTRRTAEVLDSWSTNGVNSGLVTNKGNQKTTITSSTAETTIASAVAATFLDVYGLVLANTSASACNVTIKDATSGTTRFVIAVPAGDTRGFMLPTDAAHKQASANNNWTATCSASVASMEITVLYLKRT